MRIVVVENSRSCNLRCPACPTTYCKDYPEGFMDQETFKACMDNVDWSKYDGCALTGWGEPLLDPEYFNRLRRLKKMGIVVGSTSNMTLLSEELLKRLDIEGLDQLNISVDTLHAEAMGKEPKELLELAERLTEAKQKNKMKLKLSINAVAVPQNLNFITELSKRLPEDTPMGVVPLIMIPTPKLLKQLVTKRQMEALKEEVLKHHPNTAFPYLDPPPLNNCRSDILNNVYITKDGMVSPCCVLAIEFTNCTYQKSCGVIKPFFVGNIKKDPLEKILHSNKLKKFAEEFKNKGVPSQCRYCNAWRNLP